MSDKFVHLHVHTEYSLLDGLSRIKDLLNFTKDNGMDSIAVTDHGVMYGVIEFFKKAKEMNIKPIIGMEGYISNDLKSRDRSSNRNYHLLLLAKNEDGYKNLMKLTSIAHLEGYYYRPRMDFELLKKYSKNLICTSACGMGEIPASLFEESYEKAKIITQKYLDLFGEDFYIELQLRDYAEVIKKTKDEQIRAELIKMNDFKEKVNPLLIKLSRDLGIPLVATNDSHYTKKSDATAQDAAVCISTGKTVNDIKRLRFIDFPDYYVKTPDEMADAYREFPDAIQNTIKISEKCNLNITTLGKWFFPKISLPKNKDANQHLRDLVEKNAKAKLGNISKVVKDRIEHELEIIANKGYSEYFVIVMDMVQWCDSKGIITNTRGSAAGSIISFILGITTVNPLKYYLPFERFLNPYRPSPPDIDLDIADDRREELLNYISEKYGHDKVAQICTFGRMLSRQSVRDVARVLGYPYETGDRISKLIPPPKQGFPITIPRALATVDELKNVYDTDADAKKILDLAIQIEGNARHISVHAAGVVISPTEITNFTPVQKEPSGEKIITQYEMHAAEDVGLIKFDVLGIRNLSILGAAVMIVKENRGIDINLKSIPLDDEKTFIMLGNGSTMGVFQLSSSGMTKYLIDLKPERVEDLMAMVALYRPGPIAVIPEYIRRKKDPSLVTYLDKRMEKFLGASYGLIVYQDDLLFCALDLAGYSWEEADKFRKAVGKKIPEEMAAQKQKFIEGVVANGQTKNFAENLWKLFEPFQSYGFNKAHAASYGMVAYQTAYMKANFPVEYMCALLTAESKDTEKVSMAVGEAKKMGIKVFPPDINKSGIGFTIEKDSKSLDGSAIRFGLDAIKNVGAAAIEAILLARNEKKFDNFSDLLIRVDGRKVNKKVLESLIKVGAMQLFGNRATLLASMEELRAKLTRKEGNKNQQGLFSQDQEDSMSSSQNSKQILDSSEEFSEEEIQSIERQLLGFSLSAKPLQEIIASISTFATHKVEELTEMPDLVSDIKIAGVLSEIRIIITKKSGKEMAFAKAIDETGDIGLVIFPNVYESFKDVLAENKPFVITGKLDSRDDEYSIIVDKMETEEIANGNPGDRLYIRIPKSCSRDTLNKLNKFLHSIKGNQNVSLLFEGNSKRYDLPVKIKWNNQIAGLINDVLGSDERIS
ncbi:MAG TPA: DNA polymerase III subunit alpha [Patescibacteria group bacterium]|nr:DNA polymerase III subunit alpha [Patescibacteria group bacterium]